MAILRTHSLLSWYLDGLEEVEIKGASLRECLLDLALRYPRIAPLLVDKEGVLRLRLRAAVEGTAPAAFIGLDQPLADDAQLLLLPPVAGG
jgi:molybdopterin converting factor small subunit